MGILAAFAVGSASAQTSVDRTFKAGGENGRDVEWSKGILRDYPGIGAACQSVEHRAGKTYVKFRGTVKEIINNGQQVRIDFREGDTLTLAPPANAVLYVDGRETPMSQLRRGARLNFDVPEDQLTAHFFADDRGATSVAVPIVSEPIVAREQGARADALKGPEKAVTMRSDAMFPAAPGNAVPSINPALRFSTAADVPS